MWNARPRFWGATPVPILQGSPGKVNIPKNTEHNNPKPIYPGDRHLRTNLNGDGICLPPRESFLKTVVEVPVTFTA
jgi:hypothetical protein